MNAGNCGGPPLISRKKGGLRRRGRKKSTLHSKLLLPEPQDFPTVASNPHVVAYEELGPEGYLRLPMQNLHAASDGRMARM